MLSDEIFESAQTARGVAVDIKKVSRLFPRAYVLLIHQLQGWENYSILDLVARGQKQKPGVTI